MTQHASAVIRKGTRKIYKQTIHLRMAEIIRTEKRRAFYLGAVYFLYCIFQIQLQSSGPDLQYIRVDTGCSIVHLLLT